MSLDVSFWGGFDKAAGLSKTKAQLLVGGVYGLGGALMGSSIGGFMAAGKNTKDAEELLLSAQSRGGRVSSKKFFDEHKHLLPKNTILLTREDLHKLVGDVHTHKELQLYQALRGLCEGNAAAIPASKLANLLFKDVPHLQGKNIVLAADELPPAIIAHEMGHIIDFDKNGNGFFRGTLSKEENAWAYAPGNQKDYDKQKTLALGTYQRNARYRRNGAIVGGLLGGLGGAAAVGIAAKKIIVDKKPLFHARRA